MKSYNFKRILTGAVLAGSLTLTTAALAQDPDNTKTNKRDQENGQPKATATKEDLELIKKIRRAVTSDKGLSTYAHNVKVTANNGAVTLRGPVRSSEEKARIEELAKTNGAASVLNELEIAPAQ